MSNQYDPGYTARNSEPSFDQPSTLRYFLGATNVFTASSRQEYQLGSHALRYAGCMESRFSHELPEDKGTIKTTVIFRDGSRFEIKVNDLKELGKIESLAGYIVNEREQRHSLE